MKIQVLQVCYVYPPSFSGYGKQLSTLNKYFYNDKDIDIKTITAYGGSDDKNVRSLFSIERPEINREKFYYYIFALLAPFINIRLFSNARIIHIVKAGPEVIMWIVLAKIFNKKVIVKVAQEELEVSSGFSLAKWLRHKTLRKVDRLVAISSKIKNEAIELKINPENIVQINNAFSQDQTNHHSVFFDYIESSYGKKKITYVGAICYRKGIPELLEALYLYAGVEAVYVSLIGPDYKEIDNLDFLIDKAMSNPRITIKKFGVRADVVDIISQSDFLILPSHSEGMPNVVVESLMVGTPVIATKIPVILDMVDVTNGVVAEIGSPQSICESISCALSGKFDRSAIKKNASKKYSLAEVGALYKKLYLELGSK